MRTVTVQDTTVPALGFGTFMLEGDEAYGAVRTALEVGYRHLDTAQTYGNEKQVGRALADSGVERDEVFITTKVGRSKAGADDVRTSTEESLGKLGIDQLDLLLLHWPSDAAPLEETLAALTELKESGRTRLIGVSNFPSQMLRRAAQIAPVATDQVEFHPFLGQDEVRGVASEHGIFVTAYSPLAQGEVLGDETLRAIAAAHDRTPTQVSLRWLLQLDDVVAIPRSSSDDHIAANFDVFDFELTDEEMATVSGLARGQRLISPGFAPDWD